MPKSDRAFRALSRAEPETLVSMLRLLAPNEVPAGAPITPDDLAATQLDAAPPPTDTDFVARVGDDGVVHLECQGYRDATFLDRVFWYHLGHALRHRPKRVHTLALWLIRPPAAQRRSAIVVGSLRLRVTHIVLPEVPAAQLLGSPMTACFAPAADACGWSDEELTRRVAAVLAEGRATWHQRRIALIAAAMHGRYEWMVKAMTERNIEPVIIEDFVKFGEDRGLAAGLAAGRAEGLAEGRVEGRVEGRAESVLLVLRSRGLPISAEQEARIRAAKDTDLLERWLARVALVADVAALFTEDA